MNASARKTIRALIVDDEALARRGLRHGLRGADDIEVVGEARHGREAVDRIRDLEPDLVFLDIQMPGMTVLEVVRNLRSEALPLILFVTTYDERAIEAFEASNFDYLLKPIEAKHLDDMLQKARTRLGRRRTDAHKRQLLRLLGQIAGAPGDDTGDGAGLPGSTRKEHRKLEIRDGGRTTWVRQEDIEWVDAAGDYMCVHALGETHIMRKTMKALEAELDADFLQRVHRSTIVNVRCVRKMKSHINGEYFLTLDNGHTIKLSRTYKDKLRYLT